MGKMKEIYEMVQDGTSNIFIDAYKQNIKIDTIIIGEL